jgi:hypothetical protein
MRFMALALLLVALYGIRTDLQAAPPQLDTPVKFDDFLSSVRAETAADARIVVVGDLPAQEANGRPSCSIRVSCTRRLELGYAHAPGPPARGGRLCCGSRVSSMPAISPYGMCR